MRQIVAQRLQAAFLTRTNGPCSFTEVDTRPSCYLEFPPLARFPPSNARRQPNLRVHFRQENHHMRRNAPSSGRLRAATAIVSLLTLATPATLLARPTFPNDPSAVLHA